MTDDTMPLEKGVYERPNSPYLWFRIKVPKALKPRYGREWAEQVSLGTADREEANLKALRLRAQWKDTFAQELRQLEGQRVERMTPDLAKFLAQQVLHDTLERADVRQSVSWRKDILHWYVRVGLVGLQTAAARAGMVVDEKTVGVNDGLTVFLTELKTALRAPFVDRPAVPKAPPKAKKLRDVFDLWKKLHKDENASKKKAALALYEQHTGNPPLTELTKEMGASFKTWLITKDNDKPKTKSDRLDHVKVLLNHAVEELGWLDKNPWRGLDIPYVTVNKRRPWKDAELKTFFGLPLFTAYALPKTTTKNGGPAAYWMPLLGLYTGARVGELAQLRLVDVQEHEGVPCININTEAEGATVKTEAGVRLIPLHPELVRLGFLEYVAALRKVGERRLWPALNITSTRPGTYFSTWFSEAVKKVISEDAPTFHYFRHGVRTMLVRKGAPESLMNAIMGHRQTGTGSQVYTEYAPDMLLDTVNRLEYPGLKLPKVYKTLK